MPNIISDAYSMINPTVQHLGFPRLLAKVADMFFNEESERIDEIEDFFVVVEVENISKVFDEITQNVINQINSSQLKEKLWEGLKAEREKGNLELSKEFLANINDSGKLSAEELDELDTVSYGMDQIKTAVEDFKSALDSSRHKGYYDYLISLKTAGGGAAVESEGFLATEIAKVARLKMTMGHVLNKTYADFPNIRAELKQVMIIPPGRIKAIPMGAYGWQILPILHRAERVAIYFLAKVRGQDPFQVLATMGAEEEKGKKEEQQNAGLTQPGEAPNLPEATNSTNETPTTTETAASGNDQATIPKNE